MYETDNMRSWPPNYSNTSLTRTRNSHISKNWPSRNFPWHVTIFYTSHVFASLYFELFLVQTADISKSWLRVEREFRRRGPFHKIRTILPCQSPKIFFPFTRAYSKANVFPLNVKSEPRGISTLSRNPVARRVTEQTCAKVQCTRR